MKNEQNVNYQAPPQGQNNHQEPPQGQNNYQATPQGQNIPQPPPPRPQGQPVTIFARPKTKNKFLTFCFSLLPGAGQMYHGLYKRGMFIMIAFWGIIAFAMTLYLPAITFLLPVIWFYSFFRGCQQNEYANRRNRTFKRYLSASIDFFQR